jgi:KUP system potassium uptake protein
MAGGGQSVGDSDKRLPALVLGALGVVFGDIGTSPLYAMRECFNGMHAVNPTLPNIYGVVSLIFWTMVIVVALKYVMFIMRADNRGEGGILALMALNFQRLRPDSRRRKAVAILAIIGATMFYGDGMITPAISVLSAVEGLNVAAPMLKDYIIPITITVLVLLFMVQARGTAKMGALFGPVMTAWFIVLGVLGVINIIKEPHILYALDPAYAIRFFLIHKWHGVIVLGAVFLVTTGGEALYADMGHFGRKPLRVAWFGLVMPGLMLNYLGQGALLLVDPENRVNPFYLMAPSWALYPLVIMATFSTIIASQAVISGVYSITRQAVQLGYLPRLQIIHTSSEEIGQIYIPFANWALFFAVIGLVVGFGTSSNLAAAYGIAVSVTMVITTILAFVAVRGLWGKSWWLGTIVILFFFVIDMAFFVANGMKITHGGWFPLVIGALLYLVMVTWRQGRELLERRRRRDELPMDIFMASIVKSTSTIRVPGTAVFLTSNQDGVPHTLLHNLKHNKVLHERVILLTMKTEEIPRVAERDRLDVVSMEHNVFRIVARYGFTEDPNLPRVLERCKEFGLVFDMMDTTFFLGRETLIPTRKPGMALWREKLFVSMSRNAWRAMDFFRIPTNRVVELGTQTEI